MEKTKFDDFLELLKLLDSQSKAQFITYLKSLQEIEDNQVLVDAYHQKET